MIQSSRDLRYFLVSGPISWQSFRIVKAHQAQWHGFRLSFCALAVSHAVSIEYEDQQLTEFLSCVPIQVTARIIKDYSILRLPGEVTSRVFGMDYSFRVSLAAGSGDDAFRHPFKDENQITAHYPISQGLPTPITRIGWRMEHSEVFVATVHNYPEEDRVVRSESVFRFAPDLAS